ncbi:hypothetical protein JTE90_012316 [Oedothorax gibbosus]|uniref:Uncharacterized protein n=1 Tax=Oedothorax gibbosus TaxID=931172 RepID=A0AAV6VI73_9ARAC|nr:hypothetical protein JTE90_012316 [Oedothorax gibbosus]
MFLVQIKGSCVHLSRNLVMQSHAGQHASKGHSRTYHPHMKNATGYAMKIRIKNHAMANRHLHKHEHIVMDSLEK